MNWGVGPARVWWRMLLGLTGLVALLLASHLPGGGLPPVGAADEPAISSVSPTSGPISGGTDVTISGSDFDGTNAVTFGGTLATFTVQNDSAITAIAPAHSAGVVDIRVTTPEGTSPETAADDFTYIAAGVTIAESDGATAVVEGGAGDSYSVALIAEPTGTVTVTVTGDSQVSVSPTMLTFTTANVAQTVTVTAVDDVVVEGTHAGTITHAASGGGYTGIPIAAVSATISDNDVAAVVITESGGVTAVAEGGGGDSYTVVLTTPPSATAVITASAGSQVIVVPTVLSFTPTNWNVAQTVTVTAVDDVVVEGTHAAVITHSAAGGGFSGVAVPSVTVTIVDNDTIAGAVIITESGGSTAVAEGGASDTYTVVLGAQPSGSVTVTASSTGQVSLFPATLGFTPTTWNIAQTITVTAVDDSLVEGTHSATISHLVFGDGASGATVTSVTVTITDNDAAGVLIPQAGGATLVFRPSDDTYILQNRPTSNFGTKDNLELDQDPVKHILLKFALSGLSGRPVASVKLRLYATEASTVGGFFFRAAHSAWSEDAVTWNTAPQAGQLLATLGPVTAGAWQEIDLTALGVQDGSITLRVTTTSEDRAAYASKERRDGNRAPELVVTLLGGAGLHVSEGGAGDTYTVALTSQPSGTVTIVSAGAGQVRLVPATLTFTSLNWSAPQTVTVNAIDDAVVEGSHSTTITHVATGGGYTGVPVPSVRVSIADNDLAAVNVRESSGTTSVAEGGATDSYSVALGSAPSGAVTITISSGEDVRTSPTTLTFTPQNWSTPQTVTVSAVDDAAVEGTHSDTITHVASGGGFTGVVIASVFVSIADDDVAVSISLPLGMELIGWFGAPTTSTELLGANPQILRIWAWEHETRTWVVDDRILPASRRVSIPITRGRGYFVVTSAPTLLLVPLE